MEEECNNPVLLHVQLPGEEADGPLSPGRLINSPIPTPYILPNNKAYIYWKHRGICLCPYLDILVK